MPWEWLYYVLLIVLLVTGLFVNILGLPGLWLMVAAHAAFGWLTGWGNYVGWGSLVAIIVLGLMAEGVEFLAGAAGSKAAGGSKRGMAGAIIGGIVGGLAGTAIPVPILGTIIGAVIGAGLGAFLIERAIGRTHEESMQIGFGAAKGRFWGILGKSAFGIVMFVVSVLAALPVGRPPSASAPATTPPATGAAPLPATVPAVLPATLPTTQDVPVER
jgi:uncharacterized protein YqgC (DUF456 family)